MFLTLEIGFSAVLPPSTSQIIFLNSCRLWAVTPVVFISTISPVILGTLNRIAQYFIRPVESHSVFVRIGCSVDIRVIHTKQSLICRFYHFGFRGVVDLKYFV